MMLKSAKFSTYEPITTQEKRSLNCNGGDWFRIDIFYAKFHIPKKKILVTLSFLKVPRNEKNFLLKYYYISFVRDLLTVRVSTLNTTLYKRGFIFVENSDSFRFLDYLHCSLFLSTYLCSKTYDTGKKQVQNRIPSN